MPARASPTVSSLDAHRPDQRRDVLVTNERNRARTESKNPGFKGRANRWPPFDLLQSPIRTMTT